MHHVDGTAVQARVGGNARGPVLVLLHGFPQTHVMWHRVATALARDYRVVLPDLRGYGDSALLPGTPDHAQASKRAMAADIVGLLGQLGHDRFFLCGHDRGARVAHRLALDHPQTVQRLCLIDIAPTLDMYAATNFDFARAYYHWFHLIQPAPLPERMIGGDPLGYLHAKLGGWGGRGLGFIEPRALAEYERCFARPEAIHAACEDYRASAGIDLAHDRASRSAGQRIACDTLVLWGERGVVHAPVRSAGAVARPVRGAGQRPAAARGALHPRGTARGHRERAGRLHALRRDHGDCLVEWGLSCGLPARPPGLPSRDFGEEQCMFKWLQKLDDHFPVRYTAWLLCAVAALLFAFTWVAFGVGGPLALVFGLLTGLGVRDTRQTRHSVLRNYPVIGHLRFLLEYIRPEIRQYFIESDNEAAPFSRQQRSLVYQRAKGESDKRPFGTQLDVGAIGYEWINHSLVPTTLPTHDFRVADRRRPARSPTAPASSTSRR